MTWHVILTSLYFTVNKVIRGPNNPSVNDESKRTFVDFAGGSEVFIATISKRFKMKEASLN